MLFWAGAGGCWTTPYTILGSVEREWGTAVAREGVGARATCLAYSTVAASDGGTLQWRWALFYSMNAVTICRAFH